MSFLLPTNMFMWVQEYFLSKCTFELSSIPGPAERIYFADAAVTAVHGFVPPLGDLALCLSMFSLEGRIYFGLLCDESLPEPHRIFDHFTERLTSLRLAL